MEESVSIILFDQGIMASGPIISWKIDGKTVEIVTSFIFGGSQNQCRWSFMEESVDFHFGGNLELSLHFSY